MCNKSVQLCILLGAWWAEISHGITRRPDVCCVQSADPVVRCDLRTRGQGHSRRGGAAPSDNGREIAFFDLKY